MLRKHRNKFIILLILISIGVALQISELLEPQKAIAMARQYADNWWLIVVLIVLQVILFTFALAGSSFLWVAATLYPPVTATLILAFGATLGGISAYFFSQRLTEEWIHKVENNRVYKLLQKEDNFFTLLALRVMPAFPHSIINYSSGILNIKLIYFIPAAFIGIGIKSFIFSRVIYNATSTASMSDLLSLSTFGPLILLSALLLLGIFIKYRIDVRNR